MTFVPTDDFIGYPDGKTPVQFRAGVTSIEVTAEFVALMRVKGLAEDRRCRPAVRLRGPSKALSKKLQTVK